MIYHKVFLESLGYQLAPMVVTSSDLEERLSSVYQTLRLPAGHLEQLTGIAERRWWEPGFPLSQGAIQAARKALASSTIQASDLGVLIYAGVCREQFEPATVCRVADSLGVRSDIILYDLSNACLGVLNAIVEIANRIELGHIRAGMVVSCESAQDIMESTIEGLIRDPMMESYITALATLTGGSGAAAVLLSDGSFPSHHRHRLRGGIALAAPEHHALCRWGLQGQSDGSYRQVMATDSIGVMKHGIALGEKTWQRFLAEMAWGPEDVDRVICHQVGAPHRDHILRTLHIPEEKDFSTFAYLGNMGTVSLPITAAMAAEQQVLLPGHHVGWLGIGSGLTCLMLGIDW